MVLGSRLSFPSEGRVMSLRLLKKVAPGYRWQKIGVNIYSSADGLVEVSVLHIGKRSQGYSQLRFLWRASGLVAEGWVRDEEEDADAWSATFEKKTINAFQLPLLPNGTAELVWVIFILLEIARRKAA